MPTTEIFRTPDERFAQLPGYDFEPRYREVEGLRLHYLDEGAGPPVVCFHGEPTWAYLYRRIAPPLVEAGRRVVCPDLAGFGRSDKPTDRHWYSYDRHVDVVSALLDLLDLKDAVIVVHDWGGPIGLRWAVENSDRVSALVLLNTGLYVGYIGEAFMQWRRFAESNPDLPVGMVLQGGTKTELPDDVVAAYEAPFPTPESKAGAAQFPLLVPLGDDDAGAAGTSPYSWLSRTPTRSSPTRSRGSSSRARSLPRANSGASKAPPTSSKRTPGSRSPPRSWPSSALDRALCPRPASPTLPVGTP